MSFRSLYFDKFGQPITVEVWSRLAEDFNYKVLCRTALGPGRFLSTVWLGLDHNHGGEGPPIIFETMVMPEGDHCRRYSTLEEAMAGHKKALKELDVKVTKFPVNRRRPQF